MKRKKRRIANIFDGNTMPVQQMNMQSFSMFNQKPPELKIDGEIKGLDVTKAKPLDFGKSKSFDASKLMAGLGGGADIIATASNLAQIDNAAVNNIENKAEEVANNNIDTSSIDSFLNSIEGLQHADSVGYKDLLGRTGGQTAMGVLGASLSGAGTGNSVGGPWGALAGGLAGLGVAGIGAAVGRRRAKNKAIELNRAIAAANDIQDANIQTAANIVNQKVLNNMMGNINAEGGPLHTNGATFSNGITFIGNGGTHEENPFEGVQMGVDPQGVPNLVEEGEVIFQDYVFSNRIKVPESVRSKYKLRKNKDLTFADAAKFLQKESEERPNDPISKRGLEDGLFKLMQEQEILRQKRATKQGNKFYTGGPFKGMNPDLVEEEVEVIPGIKTGNPFAQEYTPAASPTGVTKPVIPEISVERKRLRDYLTPNLSNLRYTPVLGAAIGAVKGAIDKPDYSRADALIGAVNDASTFSPIEYTPIGNYMAYRPFDRDYFTNKLNTQVGTTRRAIINQSAGNRAGALASTIAADYNMLGRMGELARQAEEYNLAQRQAVEQFNRGTNQANAEMGLKAAMANRELAAKAKAQRISGLAQALSMKESIDAARGAGINANLSNLFNSLGDIGREEYSRNMIISNPALYYSIGRDGNITYKSGFSNLSDSQKEYVRAKAEKDKVEKTNTKKEGR